MSSSPFVQAQLSVQLLEPLFYGIYVVTLGFCLEALLRNPRGWKAWAEISKTMLIVVCLMAFFATFDVILGFMINMSAVLYQGPGGPEAAYNRTSSWMNIMGVMNVIIQTVLGDCMLIYRCWVVYGRSWRIIAVPVVIAVSGLVCIALSIYYQVVLPEGSQLMSPYREIVIATWAQTISINILTTSLIVLRIWRVGRQTSEILNLDTDFKSTYDRVIKTIVQSGLLYTVTACMTAITYISGSFAYLPLSGMDVQVIGISFNLILIRVHGGHGHNSHAENNTRPPQSTLRFSIGPSNSSSMSTSQPSFPSSSMPNAGDDQGVDVYLKVDERGETPSTPSFVDEKV